MDWVALLHTGHQFEGHEEALLVEGTSPRVVGQLPYARQAGDVYVGGLEELSCSRGVHFTSCVGSELNGEGDLLLLLYASSLNRLQRMSGYLGVEILIVRLVWSCNGV